MSKRLPVKGKPPTNTLLGYKENDLNKSKTSSIMNSKGPKTYAEKMFEKYKE